MIAKACRWIRTCSGAAALVALAVLITLTPVRTAPTEDAGTPLSTAAAGVTIGTMPVVANFPVTLDGVTRLTDATGRVRFDTTAFADSRITDRITLTEAVLSIDGRDVKVTARRLFPFLPVRMLALELSYPVSFEFSGLSGAPIDAASIDTITVKSPTGEIVDLPAAGVTWLRGSRAVSAGTTLVPDQLEWAVQRVEFAGSNVVNVSQQRFRPAEQRAVDLTLLFFSLDLRVHDALFGHPQGGTVELAYPDGHTERFDVDDDGRLSVTTLPRGQYTLTILGPGPAMSRPLTVSRDQDLELAFYSWWDIGTLVGALAALAVGLAVTGAVRRRRQAALDRSEVSGAQDASGAERSDGVEGRDDAAAAAPAPRRPQGSESSPAELAGLGDRRAE